MMWCRIAFVGIWFMFCYAPRRATIVGIVDEEQWRGRMWPIKRLIEQQSMRKALSGRRHLVVKATHRDHLPRKIDKKRSERHEETLIVIKEQEYWLYRSAQRSHRMKGSRIVRRRCRRDWITFPKQNKKMRMSSPSVDEQVIDIEKRNRRELRWSLESPKNFCKKFNASMARERTTRRVREKLFQSSFHFFYFSFVEITIDWIGLRVLVLLLIHSTDSKRSQITQGGVCVEELVEWDRESVMRLEPGVKVAHHQ